MKQKCKSAYSIIAGVLISINGANADVLLGAEINPAVLGGKYISGGFNAFFPEQAFEIAIPFVYRNANRFWCDTYENSNSLTVDIVARKYLRYTASTTMPYAGLLLRHRRLEGQVAKAGLCSYSSEPYDVIHRTARNAYALNIGFRRIIREQLYIGASFSYGQYFDNGIDGAQSPFSGKTLRDIEFFKLGYIFN